MRRLLVLWVLIYLGTSLYGQEALTFVAPNVFLRGIPVEQGFRYTATLIKSADDAALRNLSVEITLPANAHLVEMLVPRQVQFDVIRRDRQNRLTLIWQISRIDSTTNLDTFSFTLAQPLTSDLEFYAQFEDETGVLFVQNFQESPTLVTNTVQVIVNNAPISAELNATLLAAEFNPPIEYGDLWWCSLLQLDGVVQPLQVIVPLRRPIAPFTELILFQQQADNTWLPLENKGIVSADGQYVVYEHPGGLVASGGGVEIQPAIIPFEQLVIVDVPDSTFPVVPTDVPPVTDGSSNTLLISEPTTAPITDGTSNTVIIGETASTIEPITDGTSNTVIIGETAPLATATNAKTGNGIIIVGANTGPTFPTPTLLPFIDGTVRTIGGTAVPTQGVTDGTSNTILLGESTATLLPFLEDGTVRTIDGTAISTQNVTDGTSNTLPIGDGTATLLPFLEDGTSNTVQFGDGTIRTIDGTAIPIQGVTDGTSNTLLIGEETATLLPFLEDGTSNTVQFGDGSVRSIGGTAVPTQGVTDGTSNTILLGEATPTATTIKTGNGVIIVGANITPTSGALVTPSGAKTDGITTIAQVTTTPLAPTATQFIVPTVRPPVIIAPSIMLNPPPQNVTLRAFGTVTVRVVLFTTTTNTVQQCTVGGINCAVLSRKAGTRVK